MKDSVYFTHRNTYIPIQIKATQLNKTVKYDTVSYPNSK